MICRDPENPKKNTFDYIRVGVRLCYLGNKNTRKEQIEFLKPYIERLESVKHYYKKFITKKEIIPRCKNCTSYDCKQSEKCPMKDACWNRGIGRVKL